MPNRLIAALCGVLALFAFAILVVGALLTPRCVQERQSGRKGSQNRFLVLQSAASNSRSSCRAAIAHTGQSPPMAQCQAELEVVIVKSQLDSRARHRWPPRMLPKSLARMVA